MAEELLALVGLATPGASQRREQMVRHAAERVPHARTAQVHVTDQAVLAVVHTDPGGGTQMRVSESDRGLRAMLALTPTGLDTAWQATEPRGLGAEAGHVLLEVHDGVARLSGDGVAFFPAYWAQVDGEFAVSTHLASIVSLGVPGSIDEQGGIEYLAHLHPWARRTLLEGVSLLGQGGLITWREGRVEVSEDPIYPGPSDAPMTDDQAVAEFSELWAEVIGDLRERGRGRRTLLALSGGMDSRAIAAQAVADGWRPMTYTYGSSHSEESAAARRVAERLGLANIMIPLVPERMLRDVPGALDALDGAHSPGEMYELWFDDMLRDAGDVVVNGLIAGPMWGDDKAMGLRGHDAVSAHLERRFAGDVAAIAPYAALEPDAVRAMVRAGIAETLSGWDLDSREDLVMFWKQSNKMVRWGSMLTNAMRRRGLALEAPFLDRRFVAFSRRLSPAQRRNGELYLRVHREVFGSVADIPRGDDGNAPASLNHVYWSADRSFGRQMIDLASRHPVAALRRGGRRIGDVAVERMSVRQLESGADRWRKWRSVFPASALLASPVYRQRLADSLESAIGAGTFLDDGALAGAAARLRAGESVTAPLAVSRVGALGGWARDYRRRSAQVQALR